MSKEGPLTNLRFAAKDTGNEEFREACALVELPPTKRQASKWRRKTGKAYNEVKLGKK